MSQKRYVVKLTGEERERLEGLLRKGKHSAALLTKVRILLKADTAQAGGGSTDAAICEALSLEKNRPGKIRMLFAMEGLERILTRRKRATPPIAKILDGEKEARLIQLACSKAPEGRSRWTLQLLADKLVELKIVEHISDSTVHLALKKTRLNRILKNTG